MALKLAFGICVGATVLGAGFAIVDWNLEGGATFAGIFWIYGGVPALVLIPVIRAYEPERPRLRRMIAAVGLLLVVTVVFTGFVLPPLWLFLPSAVLVMAAGLLSPVSSWSPRERRATSTVAVAATVVLAIAIALTA